MPLTPGLRLGPYEVLSALGAGGMGEVYRARDMRLDRTVALKVLPAQLAADPQFKARFEQEARTISQLDHPNICALYDVGHEEGTSFLVMQYLEGETLADRLARGALPLDEALQYAEEIADALDKAHRAGVIHRDIKPGNIMIVGRGGPAGPPEAKLLDFGLARTGVPVLATPGLSMMPTTPAANLTAQGTILGTFQYMAPEQLEGLEADARTDIFAFGTVLYEMLTGRKAFEGKSQATLIAAIVGSDPPPVSTIQPVSPPMLDDVVRTCLAKNPDARWQSAGDVRRALALASKYRSGTAVPEPRPVSRLARVALPVATLVTLAAVGLAAWLVSGRRVAEPTKIAFDIVTESAPSPLHIALSPDGTRLVSIVATPAGPHLSVRRLDQVMPQLLGGTVGAAFPFWSPDGRFIAFFAGGKLNKIDVSGGPPQPLCDAPSGHGGDWNRAGVILFAPSTSGPLQKVSSGGGMPVPVTTLDRARGDTAHRHPRFLPDGRHFVFYVLSAKAQNSGLYLGSLDSTDTRMLAASDVMGEFAPPDRIAFVRGSTLMVQRFDLRRFQTEGDPTPITPDIGINTANSAAGFTFSDTGLVAYRVVGDVLERLLRWVDRSGKTVGDVADVAPRLNSRLSPDGSSVAETLLDGQVGDIWIRDLARGTSSRFTFDPAIDDSAIWSPDGSQVLFASGRAAGNRDLYVKRAGGAGQEQLVLKTGAPKYPTDWSRDGRFVLYTEIGSSPDVWVLPMSGDRKPIPFLTTNFSENRARFSPDGHWIAYTSDESGPSQVYVQSFPASGRKWQVSTNGGVEPHWKADGRELFYVNNGQVMSVEVNADSNGFTAGTPIKLFDAPLRTSVLSSSFDVTADGQRFLLGVRPGTTDSVPPIRVLVNCATGLR